MNAPTNPTGWIWAVLCAYGLSPILVYLIIHAIMLRIAKRSPKLDHTHYKDDSGRIHHVMLLEIQQRQGSTAKEVIEE